MRPKRRKTMSEYSAIVCQIHLENGIYLTTMMSEKLGIVYQLQNAIYPCRVYADPDMVAALIAEGCTIWSIGTNEKEWDMAVDIDAHARFLRVRVKDTESMVSMVYEGSFDDFLTITPEEVDMRCNLDLVYGHSGERET
jgi:hypothetical protein